MSEKKYLLIESIEDIVENGEVIGKLCSDKAGNSAKVKVGRGGHLKKKWDTLLLGRAYEFSMGEFKGFPFVEDFGEVAGKLEQKAIEKVTDESAEIRNRSITLSYAVGLAPPGSIEPIDILEWADRFYQYVTTGTIGGKYEALTQEPKQSAPQNEPDKKAEESKGIPTDETNQKGIKPAEGITVEELYQWIANNMKWKTNTAARTWIINKCKISGDRIDTETEAVYNEIKALQNWG